MWHLLFSSLGQNTQQKRFRGKWNYFSSYFHGGEGMTLLKVDQVASNHSGGDMRSLVHVSVQQEVEISGKNWVQPQPSTLLLRLYLCQLYPISQRCPSLPKQRPLLEVKCLNTWVCEECSTLGSLKPVSGRLCIWMPHLMSPVTWTAFLTRCKS